MFFCFYVLLVSCGAVPEELSLPALFIPKAAVLSTPCIVFCIRCCALCFLVAHSTHPPTLLLKAGLHGFSPTL